MYIASDVLACIDTIQVYQGYHIVNSSRMKMSANMGYQCLVYTHLLRRMSFIIHRVLQWSLHLDQLQKK